MASLTSRFGGVPIMVVRPPRSVAYANGINKRDGGIRVLRATSTTTGNMSAATPMLFMNAESTPAVIMMTMIIATSRRPASRMTWRPIISAIPVRVRPSLRMNMAQTVMTALLLNPANAPAVDTSPVTASEQSTSRATRSMRMTSLIKRISEMARMPRTRAISNVMNRGCLYYKGLMNKNVVNLYTSASILAK